MGDVTQELGKRVDHVIEEAQQDKPRTHLGFSVLGNKCIRQVWYGYRWVYHVKHKGRMLRLFNRGHGEEERIAKWLRLAGAKVSLTDPDTGKQYSSSFYGEHVGGSSDGKVSIPGVLPDGDGLFECKTHNDKSFKALNAKGLIMSKIQHYAQMQCYMGAMGLDWGLYVAVNKNDDDIHYEVVNFKPEVYEQYMDRAQAVVAARQPPPRITNDPTWWECKFCDFRETCWKERPYAINCRSCAFAEALTDQPGANWHCHKHNGILPKDFIPKGCADHVEAQ